MKTTELQKPPRRASRGLWAVPTTCPGCDKEGTLTEKNVKTVQVIREEEVRCAVVNWVCGDCGAQFMSPEQATNAVKRAVETYQKKHGLLTADEIRKGRKNAGLSAWALADKAKIGEATIKRLEAGVTVQQASTNKLLKSALETPQEVPDFTMEFVISESVACIKTINSYWDEDAQWSAGAAWKNESHGDFSEDENLTAVG